MNKRWSAVLVLALMLSCFLTTGALAQAQVQQETSDPAATAPAPKKKKSVARKVKKTRKAKVVKKYEYEKSKYKAVMEPQSTSYRFDSRGNAILPAEGGKGRKKKPAMSSEDPSCSGEACKSE